MAHTEPDVTTTSFLLPPDATLLAVGDLSPRIRARLGVVSDDHAVLTRPGHRVTTQLMPPALAALVQEFREARRLTDAVLCFAARHDEDPYEVLDLSIDALAALVNARLLVPADAADHAVPAPSLGAGQSLAGFEVDALVRSLDDSEVYRGHDAHGSAVALKVARDGRPHTARMLAHEAAVLAHLAGGGVPRLHDHGTWRGRAYIAMEWCDGVSVAVAAQKARASAQPHRLRDLLTRLLQAYASLHARGILHGDVHPGNCIVRDDRHIVLIDFGQARWAGASSGPDVTRAGLPQFYDPQIASALLGGVLPPAVDASSEQYAVGVLAYLLATGRAPTDAPAVHDVLLRHIVERAPLPFAARARTSWPALEGALSRALAKEPAERFRDLASLAAEVARARVPVRRRLAKGPASGPVRLAFEAAAAEARALDGPADPCRLAWFALRAALASGDPTLLAAADVLVERASPGWAASAVAAHIARVRSDGRAEHQALDAFVAAAGLAPAGALVMCAAGPGRSPGIQAPVVPAITRWLDSRGGALDELAACACLHLVHMGAMDLPPAVAAWLDALAGRREGSVWLWAAAYEVTADARHLRAALTGVLPRTPVARAYALLRRHQLTGDRQWVVRARLVTRRLAATDGDALATATLAAELDMPASAVVPPFVDVLGSQPMR